MIRATRRTVLALALAAGLAPVHAQESNCFATAAAKYQINEVLLRAIARVESNYDPRAIHYDSDGTHDVGIMQINSSHFESLSKYQISEDTLLNRPCTNIAVGASILAGFVRQYGLTWRAIGAYGAGSAPAKEAARIAYAGLVNRALKRLTGESAPVRTASNAASNTAPQSPRMLVVD